MPLKPKPGLSRTGCSRLMSMFCLHHSERGCPILAFFARVGGDAACTGWFVLSRCNQQPCAGIPVSRPSQRTRRTGHPLINDVGEDRKSGPPAAVLSSKLPLPESKVISSGSQMLAGGVLLIATAAILGEFRGFHIAAVTPRAWLALIYLIVAGSIIGFTAYVWLIHHESPTKVGTYAYVNPVVAVLVGFFLGGEALGARTVVGTLLVLVSVIVITTTPNEVKSAVLTQEIELAEP